MKDWFRYNLGPMLMCIFVGFVLGVIATKGGCDPQAILESDAIP